MYYCGIDIAKREHTLTIINQDGAIVQRAQTVTNDHAGFERLLDLLQPYAGQVHIGLESTGHYWLAVYDCLSAADYPVAVLNALQVRAYRKLDLRKRKTDRWDAYWIADYMRYANPEPTPQELPLLRQLRELTRFRARLTQQIGDCKRRIITILDRVFPEFERLFSSVFLVSAQRLLHEAVTAEDFASFDLSELEELLHTASRGHFGAQKAREIRNVAQHSVGVRFLRKAAHVQMDCLLAEMELLAEHRTTVDVEIQDLMAELPQFITTIPGIGLVTGAALLAEIGDVQRFPRLENLVAYTGIDPTVYRSGQFEGDRMRMSKRGSPHLRCALWRAATASLRHNAELHAYYQKKRRQGKPHGVAMGAVCRKLLARIYVILREQRPYVVHQLSCPLT